MAIGFDKADGKKEWVRFLVGVRHDGKDYGPGHDAGEFAFIDAVDARRYVREQRAQFEAPPAKGTAK